jgi:putative ABC transport system ATP-binding protein
MIQLQNIAKSYTSRGEVVELFSDLSWQVDTGAWVALMGASGAGKSTLLSLIAGIITPDSGSIYLGDSEQEQDFSSLTDTELARNDKTTDITTLSRDEMTAFRGSHIAFIFQAFELIPNLTVTENIDLVLDISHAPRRYSTHEILEKVGLSGKWNRYPNELSWWEQQRVAIARAFVADVPYLFADEPTGNLDEKNAEKIMELIRTLHEETKNTIIMITHDRGIAEHADMLYRLVWGTLTSESL